MEDETSPTCALLMTVMVTFELAQCVARLIIIPSLWHRNQCWGNQTNDQQYHWHHRWYQSQWKKKKKTDSVQHFEYLGATVPGHWKYKPAWHKPSGKTRTSHWKPRSVSWTLWSCQHSCMWILDLNSRTGTEKQPEIKYYKELLHITRRVYAPNEKVKNTIQLITGSFWRYFDNWKTKETDMIWPCVQSIRTHIKKHHARDS